MESETDIYIGLDGVVLIYIRYGHQWYKSQEFLCDPDRVDVGEDGA